MITSIEIKNIYSIKACEINFEKAKYQYKENFLLHDIIANPIAIYGTNGSGKSSLLKAIGHLVSLLTNDVDGLASFMPNLSEVSSLPSMIKICFILDGTSYRYQITSDLNSIVREELSINGKIKLDRSTGSYLYNDKQYEISEGFYPALREVVNKINKMNQVYKAFDFLSNIAIVYADRREYEVASFKKLPYRDVMVEKSSEVKELLKEYKSFPIYDIISTQSPSGKLYSVEIQKDNQSKFEMPLSFISSGMHSQSFLLSILLSLPENGVLIVDELETALHPLVIYEFIKTVLERNVQLIFSSHNTNILSKLRPDNVVFANWKNGNSNYHRLSDIYPNIREVNNIEKMYLSSTFDKEISG